MTQGRDAWAAWQINVGGVLACVLVGLLGISCVRSEVRHSVVGPDLALAALDRPTAEGRLALQRFAKTAEGSEFLLREFIRAATDFDPDVIPRLLEHLPSPTSWLTIHADGEDRLCWSSYSTHEPPPDWCGKPFVGSSGLGRSCSSRPQFQRLAERLRLIQESLVAVVPQPLTLREYRGFEFYFVTADDEIEVPQRSGRLEIADSFHRRDAAPMVLIRSDEDMQRRVAQEAFSDKLHEVEIGMTSEDVESLLGEKCWSDGNRWHYPVWYTSAIIIGFDDQGRVAEVEKTGYWPEA